MTEERWKQTTHCFMADFVFTTTIPLLPFPFLFPFHPLPLVPPPSRRPPLRFTCASFAFLLSSPPSSPLSPLKLRWHTSEWILLTWRAWRYIVMSRKNLDSSWFAISACVWNFSDISAREWRVVNNRNEIHRKHWLTGEYGIENGGETLQSNWQLYTSSAMFW